MSKQRPLPSDHAKALGHLLQHGHLVPPDQLADLVSRTSGQFGASCAVIYLIDYAQAVLTPVPFDGAPLREELRVDGTIGGRAFRSLSPMQTQANGSRRVWLPLLDGVERLGVMEFIFPDASEPSLEQLPMLRQYVHVTAELLVSKSAYTDYYEWVRRREPMNVAAELQWGLLPPLTFGTSRVLISGLLAPAYEVGGDVFDYALNGNIAHVALFDAMGHGLQASQLSALAVGTYRNARRAGLDLPDTAVSVDRVLARQHGMERFVTAVIGQLDVDTGRFRWVSAGHPAPLLLRDGRVIQSLESPPLQPLGLLQLVSENPPEVLVTQLEPGDRLLLFTDGVDEARRTDGEFFGVQRLAEFVAKHAASGEPTPEVMRRLQQAILEHQKGELQDDATTLFVEWLTGTKQQLEP